MKTVGQAAYERWRELLPLQPSPLIPVWSDLQGTGKKAWEEIAKAAINQHIDDGLNEEVKNSATDRRMAP